MQNLVHSPEYKESDVTETILTACQYNHNRGKVNIHGGIVKFTKLADGTYEAHYYNHENIIVATAVVDESDI